MTTIHGLGQAVTGEQPIPPHGKWTTLDERVIAGQHLVSGRPVDEMHAETEQEIEQRPPFLDGVADQFREFVVAKQEMYSVREIEFELGDIFEE